MDSDQGKLFIGGISWETNEDKLKDHFGSYGEVLQAVVMRDKISGKPRGFGFVVFSDPSVLDTVLQDQHNIDGRTVEAKRALSREEQQISKVGNSNNARNFGSSGNTRTKKIFVGGLPASLSEEGFRQYFESFGDVFDVVIMYDRQTDRPRGFGFITFDSEEAVDRVLHKTFHDLNGKQVEVKRALPKDANPGGTGHSMSGGSGTSGGYQGYGASGGNSNYYDNQMDLNRYMQSQNPGGGYLPYGSSGYSTPGYGYGAANNDMDYGGYGSYGGANPAYGGPASAAYGNPNVPSAGYGSGAPRSSWNSQAPTGYGGTISYGNVSWGAATVGAGGPGSNGPVSGPIGQSPRGAVGYGNQGYGYSGYGGSEGTYGNHTGYGAIGGRPGNSLNGNAVSGGGSGGDLHTSGGYMGGGYNDTGNAGWRSDPSQASVNYGAQANGPQGGQAGYGGGSARQAQQ